MLRFSAYRSGVYRGCSVDLCRINRLNKFMYSCSYQTKIFKKQLFRKKLIMLNTSMFPKLSCSSQGGYLVRCLGFHHSAGKICLFQAWNKYFQFYCSYGLSWHGNLITILHRFNTCQECLHNCCDWLVKFGNYIALLILAAIGQLLNGNNNHISTD